MNVYNGVILAGSRLCSPSNSEGPILLSQGLYLDKFWDLHPCNFDYGETSIICICSDTSPISSIIQSDRFTMCTSTKRFCNNVLQKIEVHGTDLVTCVRAAIDSHRWSELRMLETMA